MTADGRVQLKEITRRQSAVHGIAELDRSGLNAISVATAHLLQADVESSVPDGDAVVPSDARSPPWAQLCWGRAKEDLARTTVANWKLGRVWIGKSGPIESGTLAGSLGNHAKAALR